MTQAFKNMRTSTPGIPAITWANQTVARPAVDPIHPILLSAKCTLRLKVASFAYLYYMLISCTPTFHNMNYTHVLKGFYIEFEELVALGDEDKSDVPALHKNLTSLKWMELFKDYLYCTFGLRKCPLQYVIYDKVVPELEDDDPLLPDKSYGVSGSLVDELIKRIKYDDPLYKPDNVMVYSILEESIRNRIYASTIKSFARRKDGRSAWILMVSSHAGKDKWEKLQKDWTRFIINSK